MSVINLTIIDQRVDIERNFQKELKLIQNKFNQDTADAKRNDDAKMFIAAIIRARGKVESVTEDRDRANKELLDLGE